MLKYNPGVKNSNINFRPVFLKIFEQEKINFLFEIIGKLYTRLDQIQKLLFRLEQKHEFLKINNKF